MDDATAGGTAERFADATLHRLGAALAGRYELLRELGRGGMATVYVARDRKHDREVALKVMDPSLARGVGAARFLREVRIAATLTHPGIVPVFDSGEVDDTFYYVIALLRDSSLRERMRERPMPPREACLLLAEVADALDAAHRASVVHRDVKPENVLLLDGRPLVTDFGVAHAARAWFGDSLTETGAAVGTVLYMAPEQLVRLRRHRRACRCVQRRRDPVRDPERCTTLRRALGAGGDGAARVDTDAAPGGDAARERGGARRAEVQGAHAAAGIPGTRSVRALSLGAWTADSSTPRCALRSE